MATITLKYDGRSRVLRNLIASMLEHGATILSPAQSTKNGLDLALEDIAAGRVSEIEDIDEFLNQMKAECGK